MEEKKTQVLVVDDIITNVKYIIEIIRRLDNTEVYGVHNGEDALEFISKNQVDLILLDIGMPSMDGFEVCQTLKSDTNTADIPIIFLTAMVQKEHVIKGFEMGAVDYIVKPFNLTELLSRVKTHIDLQCKTHELKEINSQLEEKISKRTHLLIEANKELTKSNRQLSKANEELASLDHAKNEFITHINHELRTPLNGITGYTALLAEELTDEGSIEYLHSIDTLVSRLTRVSEISLLLTELRTTNNNFVPQTVFLDDIIQNSIKQEALLSKDLQLNINSLPNSQAVLAEPRLLSSCLSIVFDNAIKYSPCQGNIDIHIRNDDKYMSVDICDEGPGITTHVQSQLFELFAADNLIHRTHGFGIGLATAKRIMDLLGGKISIRNQEKGTSVVLHLKKVQSN